MIPHSIATRRCPALIVVACVVTLATLPARAQRPQTVSGTPIWGRASHVVVPQHGGYALERGNPNLRLVEVRAHIETHERTASTTLELEISNDANRDAEAVILLPLPDGATVGHFDFKGSGAEPSARILPAPEAERTYRSIVDRLRDPALLEFAGYHLLKTCVFPVPAHGKQVLHVGYEQIVDSDGTRVDYVLPRSERLDTAVPWRISAVLNSDGGIGAVYSPTHEIRTERDVDPYTKATRVLARVTGDGRTPGPFRLSYFITERDLAATLFSYPDPSVGGGYFLFMASAPRELEQASLLPRELTLVIDRSGSMAGAKLLQVQRAASAILDRLSARDHFNIIDYSTRVTRFRDRPVPANAATLASARTYLDALKPMGGTNIHDALVEALRQPLTVGAVPAVLFLTDGLPTVGRTLESDIRKLTTDGNPHGRRVFTLGVGTEVNAPLLDHLAESSRGLSRYVLPTEKVDVALDGLAQRFGEPALADVSLNVLDGAVRPADDRVYDLLPAELPDLYCGDQVVVLGRYRGGAPLCLQVRGRDSAGPRVFGYAFSLDQATTDNAFVARLWASRMVADLSDRVRQLGALPDAIARRQQAPLVDRILHLSICFGILTEYTAFLATEGTDLADWTRLQVDCNANYDQRARSVRSGLGCLSQSFNVISMKNQTQLNPDNRFLDAEFETVVHDTICQMANRAFVRRGDRWLDTQVYSSSGRALDAHLPTTSIPVDEEVDFGSPRYWEIVHELIERGEQASMSLRGRVTIQIDGRNVLLKQGKVDGC